eukprot:768328-Hanusia_phi.AAC.2
MSRGNKDIGEEGARERCGGEEERGRGKMGESRDRRLVSLHLPAHEDVARAEGVEGVSGKAHIVLEVCQSMRLLAPPAAFTFELWEF